MKLQSNFAILDVKRGRASLLDACDKQDRQPGLFLPVTITGFITGIHGNYDGVSQEFKVQVESVEVLLISKDDAARAIAARLSENSLLQELVFSRE